MKNFIHRIVTGFEFESLLDFSQSLIPTVKYNLFAILVMFTVPAAIIDKVFGLDAMAVAALLVAMLLELGSGIYASYITKNKFSSRRLSRFSVKTACYLILIAVPYLFQQSFEHRGKEIAGVAFEWLHTFLVVQIVLEHLFSILENLAVIQGKPKTYWITKIKEKVKTIV